MAKPKPAQCAYCGSKNLGPTEDCLDCGNQNRKPLVTEGSNQHGDWYSLEENLAKAEAAKDAAPRAPLKEIPENMRVPEHPDWYQISGSSPNLPRSRPAPASGHARRLAMAIVVVVVLLLLGVAANLVFDIHHTLPGGFGRH